MSRSFLLIAIAAIALAAVPAHAQLTNPSFSNGFPNPTGWTVVSGSASLQFTAVGGMPTDPFFFLNLSTNGTGGAVGHSNPGGAGTDAMNTALITQTFTVPAAGDTQLSFDCQLQSTNVADNDFLEVSVTDGVSVVNVVRLDGGDVTGSLSALTNASVDLGVAFPTANETTVFEIRLHVGDVSGSSASSGLFDRFVFSAGTPFPFNDVVFEDLGSSQRIGIKSVTPFSRCWHFLSGNTAGPLGGGDIFGLYADQLIFDILAFPVGTPGLHVITDGNGDYQTFVPTVAVASGSVFDYMMVVFDGGGVVSDFTAPKRYLWP